MLMHNTLPCTSETQDQNTMNSVRFLFRMAMQHKSILACASGTGVQNSQMGHKEDMAFSCTSNQAAQMT